LFGFGQNGGKASSLTAKYRNILHHNLQVEFEVSQLACKFYESACFRELLLIKNSACLFVFCALKAEINSFVHFG